MPYNPTRKNGGPESNVPANRDLTYVQEGTLVRTPGGEKAIEMVSVGDLVVTHTGTCRQVIDIHTRLLETEETLCCLNAQACGRSLMATQASQIMATSWANCNPERWKWVLVDLLETWNDDVLVYSSGSIVPRRAWKNKSPKPSVMGTAKAEMVYSLEIDSLDESYFANGFLVRAYPCTLVRDTPPESEILHFILQFQAAVETFTTGCCYWFAYILNERFGGKTMYAPVENHWVQRIGEKLYDATGDVTMRYQDEVVPWDEFRRAEPSVAQRLRRDCIDILSEQQRNGAAVIKPLVLMSSVPGDILFDPMAGSGTTAAVAMKTGRRAIVCDKEEMYIQMMGKKLGARRIEL